jgi:hypothetical protein
MHIDICTLKLEIFNYDKKIVFQINRIMHLKHEFYMNPNTNTCI